MESNTKETMEVVEKKGDPIEVIICKAVGSSDPSVTNSFWNVVKTLPPNVDGKVDGPRVYFKALTERIGVYSDKDCSLSVGKIKDFLGGSFEQFSTALPSYGDYTANVVEVKGRDALVEIIPDISSKTPVVKKPKDVLSETVERTGLSQDEVKARLDLIKFYGVKERSFMFEQVARMIAPQPEGENIPRPAVMYQQGKEEVIKTLLYAASRGCYMVLEGAKSVGKNVAWETMSYILNRKLFSLQCDRRMCREDAYGRVGTDNSRTILSKAEIADMLAEYEFAKLNGKCGADSIAPIIENIIGNLSPRLVVNYGVVGQALLHEQAGYGAILLLDEMNLSDPSTFATLFNNLTDRHSQYIEFDTVRIPISRNMIIGGTQNSLGGEFFGTNALNGASMSRWGVIKIAPPNDILGLLKTVPDVDMLEDGVLETLNRIYSDFAGAVSCEMVSDACLNVRGFKAATEMIICGLPVAQAVIQFVVNSISDPDESEALAEIVKANCK